MKRLITDCGSPHNYIWLKDEAIAVTEPTTRIITRSVYACVSCGKGLDVYDLDHPVMIEEIE